MKRSALLGGAIGDALGQPFEFNNTKQILDSGWNGQFVSGGTWKMKAGMHSDDHKMTRCIAESILEKNGFDVNHVAQKYVEWFKTGDLRGIGQTCEKAILKLARGMSPKESGQETNFKPANSKYRIIRKEPNLTGIGDFCGNGTVMRVAPIGVHYRNDLIALEKAAKEDAEITHKHSDAADASHALAYALSLLYKGLSKTEMLTSIKNDIFYTKNHIPEQLAKVEQPEDITEAFLIFGDKGTAHNTLASAMWCFAATDDFKNAVAAAVLIGGDTDTRASIAGNLAGAYYGLEGIPEEYISGVEDSKYIQELDERLIKG